jgi:uncharacterized protein YPO0396
MIPNAEFTSSLFPSEQFRMSSLQVFNWGTFSDLHDIPISEQGFLFVGPSGAGKSTLLDAFSSLLIPPRWVDFNAAAREIERTGRDRNFVTYVRGAWAEQKDSDSGLIGTRFLRSETTWSALALSFKNPSGKTVVLVQLFWLRGKSSASVDVKRHYLIFERPFDLRELKDFDLDVRKLKRSFPEVFIRDEFSAYCERFRRILGIESEMALRLLHKTQSAKNLGDLNDFLRDFMLDKPETFNAADRMVSEFAELNAAHLSVVTAREQIAVLLPAREDHRLWQESSGRSTELIELRGGTEGFLKIRLAGLLGEQVAALQLQAESLEAQVRAADENLSDHRAKWADLHRLLHEAGGDQIERWEVDKTSLESQRADRSLKRAKAEASCRQLGWSLPASPGEFVELVARARREAEGWREGADEFQERKFKLDREKTEATKTFQETVGEVHALRSQSSNIPAEMLELRKGFAAILGTSESALPFVGELIEVRKEETAWQGAIERALHGFALSILVDERDYAAFSSHINSTHTGRRLVYHRVGKIVRDSTRTVGTNSLVHKLRLKEGRYDEWLDTELRQRFDYACVDSLQAFRNAEYAITREGQMRQGKSRHEKNDRYRVDDRRHWVLGFDNHEKLALFEAQSHELSVRIEALRQEIDKLTEIERRQTERSLLCQALINLQWQEIDVETLVERIASIDRDIKKARDGNAALRKIGERIEEEKSEVDAADRNHRELWADLKSTQKQIEEVSQRWEDTRLKAQASPLSDFQKAGLDERLAAVDISPTLVDLDELMRKVTDKLTREIEKLRDERSRLEKEIERRFTDFKRQWPAEAADVDAKILSASDFFAKLNRLELDGLPAHEERFFDLLRNQSHQNLAALSTHLNQARKEIADRLELVNQGLSEAHFNPGTYLHIQSNDRQLPEVREFKQDVQNALSHAWTDDRDGAEARFLILRQMVQRLASQEGVDRRWRESVLDVRQHVDFIGRELDQEGREVEIYRSGSGKSGGQRQKLATTCLAAALRYQLGGHDRGAPAYAPVVLDEAFDKADNEFTTLAMNIFTKFGFQMIVATPLKSVMTLEPFIGGACIVGIRDRKHSGVLLIEYDSEQKRLRLPEVPFEEDDT